MLKQRPTPGPTNFNRHARIQFEGTGAGRDCLVTNLSDDGVRLYSEVPDVPAEFTLVMADAHPPRRCRLTWRLGFEFGAKFTDAGRIAVLRRAMPEGRAGQSAS